MRFFQGHRALVTGGSSGIGRATALALARAGAHVAVTARSREPLEAACVALRAAAPDPDQRFCWTTFDVADPAAAAEGVGRAIDALGGLDLLVNNAGVARALRIEDTPLDAYRRLIDVNFLGMVYVTRAALPRLIAQGSGHVVNVSSLAGLVAIYGYTAYAPSKFAVTGFSEALRQELRPHGISVSVVFPPDTDTPQLAAEDLEKPPETRAVAGTVPPLHADTVASAILRGVARRRFWIVPSWRARLVALASRHFPPLVRFVVDREIAHARRVARIPASPSAVAPRDSADAPRDQPAPGSRPPDDRIAKG